MKDTLEMTDAGGATAETGSIPHHGKTYLYAIVESGPAQAMEGIGIDGNDVHTIVQGRVAAVVSGPVLTKIRPQRANLAAHHTVLSRLMAATTPLPITFGTIAASPEAVKKILFKNQRLFLDQFKKVSGKVEMGLRVAWDVPNIFEYFVNTYSELRVARDHIVGTRRDPSQEEKIELGRMFDRLLKEDREMRVQQVEHVLRPACFEVKSNPCRGEQEVMNLACLVGRDAQEDFESAVFEAAKMFDNNYSFDYSGPWAPHNFVNLALEL